MILNETLGFNDSIKNLSEYLTDIIRKDLRTKSFKPFNNYNFKNEFLDLNNLIIHLKINNSSIENYSGGIDLKTFKLCSSNYYTSQNIIYEYIQNCEMILNLNILNDLNKSKLKALLIHELTHILQLKKEIDNKKTTNSYFQFENDYSLINKTWILQKNYFIFKTKYSVELSSKWKPFNYFLDVFYNSLDSELNAKISELWQYLDNFKTKDKDKLEFYLKQSQIYKNYIAVEEFTYEKLNNIFKNKNDFIEATDTFNDMLKLNYSFYNPTIQKILNNSDLELYFKKWNFYFKIKMKKHINKMNSLINSIINENILKKETFEYLYENKINRKEKIMNILYFNEFVNKYIKK